MYHEEISLLRGFLLPFLFTSLYWHLYIFLTLKLSDPIHLQSFQLVKFPLYSYINHFLCLHQQCKSSVINESLYKLLTVSKLFLNLPILLRPSRTSYKLRFFSQYIYIYTNIYIYIYIYISEFIF